MNIITFSLRVEETISPKVFITLLRLPSQPGLPRRRSQGSQLRWRQKGNQQNAEKNYERKQNGLQERREKQTNQEKYINRGRGKHKNRGKQR